MPWLCLIYCALLLCCQMIKSFSWTASTICEVNMVCLSSFWLVVVFNLSKPTYWLNDFDFYCFIIIGNIFCLNPCGGLLFKFSKRFLRGNFETDATPSSHAFLFSCRLNKRSFYCNFTANWCVHRKQASAASLAKWRKKKRYAVFNCYGWNIFLPSFFIQSTILLLIFLKVS